MEIWTDVIGYEGLYRISNYGKIISLSYNKTKKEKELVGSYCNGYHRVGLRKYNKRNYFFVHVLVAKHFCVKQDYQNQVNHIDSNILNNIYSNLEWVSQIENHSHKSYKLNSSSPHVGVSKYKNKWMSYISLNNKKIYLGIYDSDKQAFEARCKYEKDNNILNKYLC
jgi:hypothetical protein